MGPLPRTHGLLGAMLESPEPVRTRRHPRATRGSAAGGRARTRRCARSSASRSSPAAASSAPSTSPTRSGAAAFDDDDERLIEMLAAHAAVAIENARLYERSRELSVVEERNRRRARPARLGHAEPVRRRARRASGGDAARPRPGRGARASSQRVQELAAGGMEELRSLIFELRPAALEARGARRDAAQARRRAAARHRQRHRARRSAATPRPRRRARRGACFRIAQEALHNALRHAHADARSRSASTRRNGRLVLTVADDGVGFDPTRRGAALPAARADVDGGAGAGARRRADDRLAPGRGHDGRAWRCRADDPRR